MKWSLFRENLIWISGNVLMFLSIFSVYVLRNSVCCKYAAATNAIAYLTVLMLFMFSDFLIVYIIFV